MTGVPGRPGVRGRVVVATLAAMAVAGCGATSGPPATPVRLVARDIAYDPGTIRATVGEPVVISLQNVGALDHDLNVDRIPVRDVQVQDALAGAHGHPATPSSLHVAASPGKVGTVRFTPTAAGTYEVWCAVPGHREAGMVAILEVRARGT